MNMHKIEYEVKLTGSKLFDIVMYNAANKLCADFPGLQFESSASWMTTGSRSTTRRCSTRCRSNRPEPGVQRAADSQSIF